MRTKALGTQPASSNWVNLPHTQHVLYEHVSAAPSKGEELRDAEGCLGNSSAADPSQLVKFPVSLLDIVHEGPALEKLYPSSCLCSGCTHLS